MIGSVIKKSHKFNGFYWDKKDDFIKKYPNYIDKNTEEITYINKSKLICFDLKTKKILKIYNSIFQTTKDGFSYSSISKCINDNITGEYKGYGWCKLYLWKDSKELERYLKEGSTTTPIYITNKKAIVEYSKNNNIVRIYESLNEASRLLGYKSPGNIYAFIKYNTTNSDGNFFAYYEDFKQKNPKELNKYEERIKYKNNTGRN